MINLPSDDLPTPQTSVQDKFLHDQLEVAIRRCFYESCSGVLQALLVKIDWCITIAAAIPTLQITCSDQEVNWRVLNHVPLLAQHLKFLSDRAVISVHSPAGAALVVRVDELDVYGNS